jgi:hypothetical protein
MVPLKVSCRLYCFLWLNGCAAQEDAMKMRNMKFEMRNEKVRGMGCMLNCFIEITMYDLN